MAEEITRPTGWRQQLAQGLNTAVSGNAQAFGFSITVTVGFGVLTVLQPPPTLLDLFGFAMAAVMAFSLLNVLVVLLLRGGGNSTTGGRALLVGTATDFLAVGAGVGAAVGLGTVVHDHVAWLLTPFVAGTLYVLVQSVEVAAGREETDDR